VPSPQEKIERWKVAGEIGTSCSEKKKMIRFYNQCHPDNYCKVGISEIYKI
jgi:hypothetical protein